VTEADQQSKNLHILLHALGEYLKTHPLPPISPTLPDMHSSTTAYIALQNLFKDQHRSDLAEYKSVLGSVLERLGMLPDTIPDEEVEGFVKNSSAVAIIKGAPLSESKRPKDKLRKVLGELEVMFRRERLI
jgi:amyloid beta precursor protein binding protein 1